MKKIIIDATTNSPKVVLDPEKNTFEISGESRPKDVPAFYKPILEWLDDFGMNLSRSDNRK
ncbi:MAG: SiaC family regulatory phosphoprotein, partial [Bacteroidales bacterium]